MNSHFPWTGMDTRFPAAATTDEADHPETAQRQRGPAGNRRGRIASIREVQRGRYTVVAYRSWWRIQRMMPSPSLRPSGVRSSRLYVFMKASSPRV